MGKVQLTREQSELVESLKASQQLAEIVYDFVNEKYPVISPIYELSLDTLIRALYFNYDVV